MYAIGKHIKKAMAAFLCACLLLSYNPGFGTVGTAEALVSEVPLQSQLNDSVTGNGAADISGESGEATTNINVKTFDGSLKAQATPGFAMKTQLIKDNNQLIYVDASSSSGTSNASYTYSWTMSRDGETPMPIASDYAPAFGTNGSNVSTNGVYLKALFNSNPSFYVDGHQYTFTCTVTCQKGQPTEESMALQITVVTVNPDEYVDPNPTEQPGKRLDALNPNGTKEGTAVIIYDENGGFRKDAKLQSAEMTPADQQTYYGKLFEEGLSKLPPSEVTGDYELGRIQANEITGAEPTNDDGTAPAYIGTLNMLIPLTNVLDDYGQPRYNYNVGDDIYVLYQKPGDTVSTPKPVKATVIRDVDNALKAQFIINNADGVGPYMPGYFAVAYAPNKVSSGKQPVSHYTVTANASGAANGHIESEALLPTSDWKTGTPAVYTFVPNPSTVSGDKITYHMLQSITFQKVGNPSLPIYNGGSSLTRGGVEEVQFTWDDVNKSLKLSGGAAGATYILNATFGTDSKTVQQITDPKTYKVHVSIVGDESAGDIGDTTVALTYNKDEKAQTSALVKAGMSGVSSNEGYVVDALKLSTVRFDVNAGGDAGNGQSYYLKEIRSGSSANIMNTLTPLSDSTIVTGDMNCTDVYRQFVIGKRAAVYEPSTTLTATFTVPIGSQGIIASEDATSGRFLQREFTPYGAGSQVMLNATNPGYYAAWASAEDSVTHESIYTHLDLGNSKYRQQYSWKNWTNYSGNITYTIHFEPKPAVTLYKLNLGTQENGTVTPLGWDLDSAGYPEGETLTLNVKPNGGYKLDGDQITVVCSTGERIDFPVVGGIAAVTMPKADVARIEANFVLLQGTEKPTYPKDEFDLNLYVADPNLGSQATLGYALGSAANSSAPLTVVGTGDGNLSFTGKDRLQGSINDVWDKQHISTKVTATNANGYPSYAFSMRAATDYEVEKILVVQYSGTGTSKSAVKRTLYYTPYPTFTVEDIRGNTDVVVYFREVTSENPPTYDPDDDFDWVTVSTTLYPVEFVSATYADDVRIVKGQSFENRFTPASGYSWMGLDWNSEDGTNETMDVWGLLTPQKVVIDSVNAKTTINAAVKSGASTVIPPSHVVSATTSDQGTVTAVVGNSPNSVTLGILPEVAEGSNLQVTVKANPGYRLSDLKFNEISSSVAAWAQMTAEKNTIQFTTGSKPAGEWVALGMADIKTALGDNTTEITWSIENLLSDMIIAPVYVKDDVTTPDPDVDPDQYWTIDASVGSGVGTVTSVDAQDGFPIKIARTVENRTVRVSFTPGYTSDERAYKVTNVTVKRNEGLLADAWQAIMGIFGASSEKQLAEQAMKQGFVDIPVNANYTIVVDFGFENPTGNETDNLVMVNVKSDPLKGVATPNSVLVPKNGADSSRQFIVSPYKGSNGQYYSVEKVTVSWTDNAGAAQKREILASDTANTLLTWDTTYANVFTVNVGTLGLDGKNLKAVTVEVGYSDTGKVSGVGEEGNNPETPLPADMKKVTVSVMADGVAVAGTSNTGGVVAPRGTFYMMKPQAGTNQPDRTLVVVSPAEGYQLTKIEVDGVANANYLAQVNNNHQGFFYVTTENMAAENIIVYFEQRSIEERTITVTSQVVGDGIVVPSSPILLGEGEEYYYNIAPTKLGVAPTKIVDEYNAGTADHPNWQPMPDSTVSWERPNTSDTSLKSGFLVKADRVGGKMVDRRITVTFGAVGNDPNADLTGKFDRANIKVSTWGNGRSKLIISPNCSMVGVARNDEAKYTYSVYLPESAYKTDSNGGAYRIFYVGVNGEKFHGDKSTPTLNDLTGEVTVTFSKENGNLIEKSKLDIYVRYFSERELAGHIGGAGGNIVGETDGNGDFLQSTKNGSSIILNTANVSAAPADFIDDAGIETGDRLTYDLGELYEEGINGDKTDPDDNQGTGGVPSTGPITGGDFSGGGDGAIGGGDYPPGDYYVVPKVGYLIDKVYLHNCVIVDEEYETILPRDADNPKYSNDQREQRVAVRYSLALLGPGDGYVYVQYRPIRSDSDVAEWLDMWTNHPEKVISQMEQNALNHNILVQVTPSNAVDSLGAGNILDLAKITEKPDLWRNGTMSGDGYSFVYTTITPSSYDANTGDFTVEVGPLINWNKFDETKSTIYTIDTDAINSKLNVVDKRDQAAIDAVKAAAEEKKTSGSRLTAAADGDTTDSAKPSYYQRYTVSGNVKDLEVDSHNNVLLTIPLETKTSDEAEFPEFRAPSTGTSNEKPPTVDDDPKPTTYTLTLDVNNVSYGTLEPVAVGGNDWYNTSVSRAATNQWTVVAGTKVGFNVKANDGYHLTNLTRNNGRIDIDCAQTMPAEYNVSQKYLEFTMSSDNTIKAVFDTDENARVPVTIQVEGGHGTTSPTPGTYRTLMYEDFTFYFDADTGYVPDRVRVTYDGYDRSENMSESATSFTVPGRMLRQPTTIRVSYKLAGTPSNFPGNNLVQTGQSALDKLGTTLVQTGDNPLLLITLVVVAAGAVAAVVTIRRRKAATEARAQKHSVTRRR